MEKEKELIRKEKELLMREQQFKEREQQLELKFKEREQLLIEGEQKRKKEKNILNINKRKLKEIFEFNRIKLMFPKRIQKFPKEKELKEKKNNINIKSVVKDAKDLAFKREDQKNQKIGKMMKEKE